MSDERADALSRAGARLIRRRAAADGTRTGAPLWDAAYWGLPRVARFREADAASQREVTDACARAAVAESWFIELSGIAFCARMVLFAEALPERRLFALIGADEATHAAWLEPWVDPPPDSDAFNRFITALVETGTAQPLAYLLQVVLEGFGIVHYAHLATGCRDAALSATLRQMAQDEALHHAGGLAAFRVERLSAAERAFTADGACEFVQMIRSGPQAVVAAIDRGIGIGGEADAALVFGELEGEATAAPKLDRLRRLMAQPGMEWLVDGLDRKGVFAPCTAAQSAHIYVGSR